MVEFGWETINLVVTHSFKSEDAPISEYVRLYVHSADLGGFGDDTTRDLCFVSLHSVCLHL